ncbi:MAG: hypothetical protein HUU15_04975 [Candidatus Brocadiae bacterium]|nr:hypothetical protein [Candidatus Brocadiia bacterium]
MLDGQLADPSVADVLKTFVLLRIDLTDRSASNPARAVAQQYQVGTIPDLRVLDAEGRVTATVRARSASDLVRELGALGRK